MWRVPSNTMVTHCTFTPLVAISEPYSCMYVQAHAKKNLNCLESPLNFMSKAGVLHPLCHAGAAPIAGAGWAVG